MDHKMVHIWVKGLDIFFETRDPTLSNIPEGFKKAVNTQTKLGLD